LDSSILDKFFDSKKIVTQHYDDSLKYEFEDNYISNHYEKIIHTKMIEELLKKKNEVIKKTY
jgi:hypothetical protein